ALAAFYVGGWLAGSLVAGLFARFLPQKRGLSMLAMELPLYRRPQLKSILKMTWARSSDYLKRAGAPIAVVAACLWLLSNFGFGAKQLTPAGGRGAPVISPSPLDQSFAAQLGHMMEPALRPMGVDWRVGVGLISAFAAPEVFVSSLAIVFHVAGDEDAQSEGLLQAMRTAKIEGADRPVFTTASILGLIIFFFFSLQCMSTVAVVRKETNSSRFAALQLLFYTGLGYLASVATVQGLRLAGVPEAPPIAKCMKAVSHRRAQRTERNHYLLCALCALRWLFLHAESEPRRLGRNRAIDVDPQSCPQVIEFFDPTHQPPQPDLLRQRR